MRRHVSDKKKGLASNLGLYKSPILSKIPGNVVPFLVRLKDLLVDNLGKIKVKVDGVSQSFTSWQELYDYLVNNNGIHQ